MIIATVLISSEESAVLADAPEGGMFVCVGVELTVVELTLTEELAALSLLLYMVARPVLPLEATLVVMLDETVLATVASVVVTANRTATERLW